MAINLQLNFDASDTHYKSMNQYKAWGEQGELAEKTREISGPI